MKHTFFLLAFSLLLASWARADERVFLIAPEDVETFSYHGRSIASFLISVDEDLTAKALVSARLELRLSAEAEAVAPRTEIQVAAWEDGAPAVPADMYRPVSKVFAGDDAETLTIDVTPIFEPLFEAGGEHSLRLALGRLNEWDEGANAGVPSALEPTENLWARLHLVVR